MSWSKVQAVKKIDDLKQIQELLEAMHLIEIILLWSLNNPEKSLFLHW